ncbi:MAG: hypothetical protein HZB99_03820 [Candidatus Harrisonbacteria bacterium]|nr:hypothetical protein [Candidatus Harrisonbacteria bacterium]
MEFVASWWWLWLLSFVFSSGYVMVNQVRHMRGMVNAVDFESGKKSFTSGLGAFAAVGLVAWASALLLVVSLAINLLKYFQA